MARIWTAVLGLTIGVTGSVSSATYYVAPDGNDAAAGTEDQPWRTLQKAANLVVAGDTVVVRPGRYDERVMLPRGRSGTAEARITFRAHPLRSASTLGFAGNRNDYIRIEGFRITYTGPLWLGGGIWVDGSHWDIVDNEFEDVTGAAVQATWQSGRICSNIYLAGNRVYKCNKGFVVSGRGWLVESNEVQRLIYSVEDADYARFFGSDHVFRGNWFHGTREEEIGRSHVDGFQTFDNNGNVAWNIIIENNVIEGMYHQGMMLGNATPGAVSNIVVRNNIFVNSASWGICAYGVDGLKVHNNLFASIRYSAIGFRAYSGGPPTTGEVINNIFYRFGAAYWAETNCTLVAQANLLYVPGGKVDAGRYPGSICNVEPLFVDALKGDFRPLPNSIVIDAGVSLPDFSYDLLGVARPQGTRWDIGPYEFVDGRPSPPKNLRIIGR